MSKTKDLRETIWHEAGHWLHCKNVGYVRFFGLDKSGLTKEEAEILTEYIGKYSARDNQPTEAIAEIFSRLMSGESYKDLHPEVFHIYQKYGGPMPNKK